MERLDEVAGFLTAVLEGRLEIWDDLKTISSEHWYFRVYLISILKEETLNFDGR